jgi:PHD/YefM family antitoxin component YafN of YafNO toxin-antitoxin module
VVSDPPHDNCAGAIELTVMNPQAQAYPGTEIATLGASQSQRQPLVITQNGKAAGVLLSPAQFDQLSERARFLAAVDEGLADSEAGRVHSHASVVAEIKKRRQARSSR